MSKLIYESVNAALTLYDTEKVQSELSTYLNLIIPTAKLMDQFIITPEGGIFFLKFLNHLNNVFTKEPKEMYKEMYRRYVYNQQDYQGYRKYENKKQEPS